MSLNLVNLNYSNVRELMLSEFEKDVSNEKVFISKRLKQDSHQKYLELMRDAITSGDANSLANQINRQRCLRTAESRGVRFVKVPYNAHITLAEGEFNRLYLRGICLKAIEEDATIEIYRAKYVMQPRAESQALIGQKYDPSLLLMDLRTHIGVKTIIPTGPNSGLSGRIIHPS